LSSLIIINGEEDFLKERAAFDEARNSLSNLVIQFNYDKLSDYLEEIDYSTLNEPRTFILWNSVEIPRLPHDSDTLIVVSKNTLNSDSAKRTHEFPKLKTYESNNQVIKWILDEGRSLNIDLSSVASALFVSHGRNLRKISSEIRKLSVLTSYGEVVKSDVARSLICFSAELSPKEVVDSICKGNAARSLAFYDKMQEKTDESGWVIAYLQRHVLQFIKINKLITSGASDKHVAEKIGMHPFFYKNSFAPYAKLWSRESLIRSLDTLCALDIMHKCGKDDFVRLGLELEIVRLSEEAKCQMV
jgi:DNA polymerase III delta subunit